MNEDFAPFELAVKLKEKGFNEPCYGYYHCNGGNDSFELCGNGDRDFLNSKNKHRIAAPTIPQVLKWLRKEKKIYEGDIIKTKRYGVVHGQSNTQGADLFRVVYKNAQFYIDNKLRHFYLQDSRCNEVIGNVFDNPELLKIETL